MTRKNTKKLNDNIRKSLESQKKMSGTIYIQELMAKNNNSIQNMALPQFPDISKSYMNESMNKYEIESNIEKQKEIDKILSKPLNIPNLSEKNIADHISSFDENIKQSISEIELEKLNDELYLIEIDDESNITFTLTNIKTSHLMVGNPQNFATELYNHVQMIDDEKLNAIFTEEFLLEIGNSLWWILPGINLNEYETMSNQHYNSSDIYEYVYENVFPEINNLQNIDPNLREIIYCAIGNYNAKNYNFCLCLLLSIINYRLNINLYEENIKELQQKLEEKISEELSRFEVFKIKSYISFLRCIVKPLYIDNIYTLEMESSQQIDDFTTKQIISIKLFMVVYTLIKIFDLIGEKF